jgi:UDP-N-acetylmuramyl-tripeptide synthetase
MRLLKTPQEAADWLHEQLGEGNLHTDSRKTVAGDGFIAWPGAAADARKYVASCLEAGVQAVLVEQEGAEAFGFTDSRIAAYAGLKADSGLIAANYFSQPSKSLDVIAITGTNGKTSTAWWLAQALNSLRSSAASYACGLIGTLGVGTPGQMHLTGLTTPDPVLLQAELKRLRATGALYCAMEASSIGLAEHRLAGTDISVAVFTNFTQDHLDYHGSMESYWQAKQALFDWPGLQTAVINLDDAKSMQLLAHCKTRALRTLTVGLENTQADFVAKNIHYAGRHLQFKLVYKDQTQTVRCPVVGNFNVANLSGVIAALVALGFSFEQACQATSMCTPVPGRMETLGGEQAPLIVVDYAHTPDALAKALEACLGVTQARNGKLWCVFGCGGNRDASKRPLMAQAAQLAEKIVLTSDNPRDESPSSIAAQVQAGFHSERQIVVQLDRAKAIEYALGTANAQDVVLLAGKGHEDYQEIAGRKYRFSDIAQAQLELAKRKETT